MLIVVILGVLTFFGNGQNLTCYSDCKKMAYYTCDICYDSCPSNGSSNQNETDKYVFSLKRCTQTYCAYYVTYVVSTGKTFTTRTYCGQYKQRDLSQNDCVRTYCGDPGYNTFTNQTFNQCYVKNEQLQKERLTIMMIIGIVFGGLILAAIVLAILKCCGFFPKIKQFFQSCTKCFRSNATANQNNQVISENPLQNIQIHSKNNQNQNSNSDFVNLPKQQKLVWNQALQVSKQNPEEYCSICLDKNMNCQTSCGHKFHFICFAQWVQKNASCPICKNQSFNNLNFICQKCFKYEAKYHLKINQDKNHSFPNGNLICQQCTKTKEIIIRPKFEIIENQNLS